LGGQRSREWGVAVWGNIEELHVRRVVGFIAHWMAKILCQVEWFDYPALISVYLVLLPTYDKPNKNCTAFTKSFCMFLNNGCIFF
jgi:hypothetical protein